MRFGMKFFLCQSDISTLEATRYSLCVITVLLGTVNWQNMLVVVSFSKTSFLPNLWMEFSVEDDIPSIKYFFLTEFCEKYKCNCTFTAI